MRNNRIFKSKYYEIYAAAGARADNVARAMVGIEIMEDPVPPKKEEVSNAPAASSEGSGSAGSEAEGSKQAVEAEAEVQAEAPES